ncbi:MAG: futalosine hydrolase [Actinomycetota bacterium]|nr:futalosine hydrolase [Actinomycetota bacterium]
MLLVVTATDREAAPFRTALRGRCPVDVHGVRADDGRIDRHPVRLAVCGIGRASTAFHLARLLLDRPQAVLQFGVAGAFPDGPPVGGVALATEDVYADLGVATEEGWLPAEALGIPLLERAGVRFYDAFPCASEATAAAAATLDAVSGRFVTVETVTGSAARAQELVRRHRPIAESMEGAAAAHACALDEVPFVQLRAMSNPVGPRDRAGWRLDEAVRTAAEAVPRVTATVLEATVSTSQR